MTITLNTKEFDEAVLLWLQEQGFSTDRFSISTRVIAGRSDGPLGTRIEATLEPKSEEADETYTGVFASMGIAQEMPIAKGVAIPKYEYTPNTAGRSPARKFGQGHADE